MLECRAKSFAFVFGIFGADFDFAGLTMVADGVVLTGTDGAGHARDVSGLPVLFHGGVGLLSE
jgi:hypothetical protein